MKKIFLFILLTMVVFIPLSHAQLKKANKLFQLYRYAEAIPLYTKVVEKARNAESEQEASTRLADCYRFTNNVELNVYLRYEDESLVEALNFKHIHERYHSDSYKFVIGKINLQNLIDNQEQIAANKAFIAFADQLAGISLAPKVKLVAEVVE